METSTENQFERERPESTTSDVSLKSDRSMGEPLNFSNDEPSQFVTERPVSSMTSDVSLKSDRSMGKPVNFSNDEASHFVTERPVSSMASDVSLKSDRSMGKPVNFSNDEPSQFVTERPVSSMASDVSLKSDRSMGKPVNFSNDEASQFVTERPVSSTTSDVSLKSDRSMGEPLNFSNDEPSIYSQFERERPESSTTSDVSLKSDRSMGKPVNFSNDAPSQFVTKRPVSSMTSDASLKSDRSMGKPVNFSNDEASHFVTERPVSSMTSDVSLKSNRSMGEPLNFSNDKPSRFQSQNQMGNVSSNDDPNFTEDYENGSEPTLPTLLKKRIIKDYRDESKKNSETDLFEIKPDEQKHLKDYSEIFKPSNEREVRVVLTKGVARIGKTFKTKMMMVEWAKGNSNKDIDLIVSLHFNKLNSFANKVQSMEDLLNYFFRNNEQHTVPTYDTYKIVFVLDGLEKCELDLDFEKNEELTDIKEQASMDVLLTSLIKGKLLPSARIWILSQPSGVDKIPTLYIHKVTECRENGSEPTLPSLLKKRIIKDYRDESKKNSETDLFEIKPDEQKHLKDYSEIFKPSNKREVRVVLTKGVARIGKTFKTKMMMVEWAKGNSNKDIDLIVSLHFNKLNSFANKVQSMEDLLNYFFRNNKQHTVPTYDTYKIVFVLDGLEKCELDLDFEKNEELTDIKEQASMDVLLTSLIKGKLLPSARIWILSQHSGVDKIQTLYIHKVTECRETLKRRKQLVSDLKKRYSTEYAQAGDKTHPNQKNIEHIIREESSGEVEDKNGKNLSRSVTKVNAISDVFKDKNIKKVLTVKQPDIGETFHVQKFIKGWAAEKNYIFEKFQNVLKSLKFTKAEDEEILFPLHFCQLNRIKDKTLSMEELINHFFEETKRSVVSDYENFHIVFLLDGLESCQLPLDFKSDIFEDVRKQASVDVLVTNLIKGNLLPSAKLWIISETSSVKRLPDGIFDRTTEIREKPDITSQRKLKSQLKDKYTWVSEGHDQQKTSALLNNVYTSLYIITGERGEVNVQHETRQVQEAKFKPMREEITVEYHDILKPVGGEVPVRSVLTLGVAGVGKTFASMKFILDWAEDSANKNINFIFPLPFRELNLMNDGEYSFEELIYQFFPSMKTSEITNYDKYQILIVLDGLDECRCDLNFNECTYLADVKKESTVNVLLANLIKGNLLPKAQIWITSRPAASNNIPADKVQQVTEVRGFSDEQKEEYFRKRFSDDEDLAKKVFSHVKNSRSLFIMCHIPVFCLITAKVLEDFVHRHQEEEMPRTLTDMYIHFILLQCRQANVKYDGEKTDTCWNKRNKETVVSLAKLAFEEAEKGNFLFTQEDLPSHIDIENSAVFSGLFTQVKQECNMLYQKKFFCFVHLSIQEFLAAFHVFLTFSNRGENLLMKQAAGFSASDFYKTAVDKALDSKNGDWDLFLRFLLGLSQEKNQDLLQGMVEKSENNKETNKEVIEYIKGKISEEIKDSEKNLNLFHCLNELNDHSLLEEVKKYMQSKTLPFEHFSASQWSALTFALLMSDENLDVFDLKKYLKSEKVLLGMLPVVKVSKTALLSWCDLSEESCKGLTSSVLHSSSCNLTVLDLSHNDLLDSGVELLADGLKSLHCLLETLKLAGCQVTKKGCSAIASALKSNTNSHLKHLDLSYNHPGDNESKMLTDIKDDPKRELKTLRLEHGGAHRLKLGLKKYGVNLVCDKETANRRITLCEQGRKIKTTDDVKERDAGTLNQNRSKWTQVFCDSPEMPNKGLTGICYWEVMWEGEVGIAVAYEKVGRKLDKSGGLGCNEISWSLVCSKTGYTAKHGATTQRIESEICNKIAVLLDWDGGCLHYYSVTPEKLSHIHTFFANFTKPLFPGFWFKKGSVTLCDID